MLTESKRVRTTLTMRAETYKWLIDNAQGPHSVGEALDFFVQEKRLLVPLEQRLKVVEQKLSRLGG